jgi:hypothetical protein
MGRVVTHEVGHWLNCYHIWGDENECSGTDQVADTPNQSWSSEGCPTFPQCSCNNCDDNGPGNMFMNYMDYTDGSCMNLFTKGQKTPCSGVVWLEPQMAQPLKIIERMSNLCPINCLYFQTRADFCIRSLSKRVNLLPEPDWLQQL